MNGDTPIAEPHQNLPWDWAHTHFPESCRDHENTRRKLGLCYSGRGEKRMMFMGNQQDMQLFWFMLTYKEANKTHCFSLKYIIFPVVLLWYKCLVLPHCINSANLSFIVLGSAESSLSLLLQPLVWIPLLSFAVRHERPAQHPWGGPYASASLCLFFWDATLFFSISLSPSLLLLIASLL